MESNFEKALAELVNDYKFMINECPEESANPSDNTIRATARWYGVDACDLYEAFNAAIAAA